MIPFSDPSQPDRIFPVVNIGLIVVNFLVFFYELSLEAQGTSVFNAFVFHYGLVPCEYTAHCHPYAGTPAPFEVTLLTSMFMHGGWLHILGNMVFLWVFGDNIENAMGHLRYLLFYLLCGLAANGLEIATAVGSSVPGLGASGAIAGVLGAYLVLLPTAIIRTLVFWFIIPLPVGIYAWVLIGFWFVEQLFSGVTSLGPSAQTGGVAFFA